jgi:hypothetical protein
MLGDIRTCWKFHSARLDVICHQGAYNEVASLTYSIVRAGENFSEIRYSLSGINPSRDFYFIGLRPLKFVWEKDLFVSSGRNGNGTVKSHLAHYFYAKYPFMPVASGRGCLKEDTIMKPFSQERSW